VAKHYDISGLLAFVGREGDWRDRLQDVVAEHLMPALEGAVRRMRTSVRSPNPTYRSGSEKAAPLYESGGAGLLVCVAVLKVALRGKVVLDRGMN
jgi:hypothetical protein